MCGIVSYIGKNNASDILLEKLQKVEYRGYDSAGLSVFDNDKIITIKDCGRINNLASKVLQKKLNSSCGIAHTRWATHGEPTAINAHPHNSDDNKISIVHNGIIENFEVLKQDLIAKGATFASSTDSEVVAHCLNFTHGTPLERMAGLFNTLKGSFAVVALFDCCPNTIYAIANKSPLILGKGKNCIMTASDVTALVESCDEIYRLNDNEILVCKETEIILYDKELNAKKISWEKLQTRASDISMNGYKCYMEKEIFEIPDVMQRTYSFLITDNWLQKIIAKHCPNKINTLHFIGCGTALHSGKIAKKFCNKLGLNAQEHFASEFRYSMPPLNKNDLCVFISQSGETADTIEALKVAKEHGITTCAVTNNLCSTITHLADFIVPLQAGVEIAVASTKAYNAQLVALYILIIAINSKIDVENSKIDILSEINNFQKFNILNLKNQIDNIAEIIKNREHIFFIGKDYDYITAQEGALKLKEISYIHCEAFPAGELKHGTLALIDNKSIVIALATQDKLKEKTLNALYEVKSRGAYTILISDEKAENSAVDYLIKIPKTNEHFAPLLSVVPCQLLALLTTQKKGLDPDKPRNLAKSVTVE